jgi:uncharacterized protein
MSDLTGTVSALNVYPIKSCAGFSPSEVTVEPTGWELDRQWMVVDARGQMLTQRSHARLALVSSSPGFDDLKLRAPGMLGLHLALDVVEAATRVQVWDDVVKAFDMGNLAGQWFSDFLGVKGLRLVRFDPDERRLVDRRWSGEVEAEAAFSDGFPVLVVSAASLAEVNRRLAAQGQPAVNMQRFRPNLVLQGDWDPHAEDFIQSLQIEAPEGPVELRLVKPCVRCSIPDIDPTTAEAGSAVGQVLRDYRADPRMQGGLTFGMNAIIVSGFGHTVKQGAAVEATIAF